jgi:hypothetical protein
MAKKKITQRGYAGFLLSFEPNRSGVVDKWLRHTGEASDSFSEFDWQLERRELALLALASNAPSLDALVMMERMHGNGGTGKQKMRMRRPVFFDPSFRGQELQLLFPKVRADLSPGQPARMAAADWAAAMTAIKEHRPAVAAQIDALIEGREAENPWTGQATRTLRLAEQRDAVGLALDVGAIDRREVFRAAKLELVGQADSVLDLLDSEQLHEQDLIRRDQQAFQGLLMPDARSVRFKGTAGREVRVHVYDKKPLETLLGIDLLIYLEAYQTFVMLQYKTMQRQEQQEGQPWSYLVDGQLNQQLAAMATAERQMTPMTASPPAIRDWRLREEAFFFKFCQTIKPNARDEALAPGITMCRSHLEAFLALSDSDGPHGGKRVGYDNCPRYLNNTQFVDLVREGWVGCGPQGFKFMHAVLRASQEGGRAAVLAVVGGEALRAANERPSRQSRR